MEDRLMLDSYTVPGWLRVVILDSVKTCCYGAVRQQLVYGSVRVSVPSEWDGHSIEADVESVYDNTVVDTIKVVKLSTGIIVEDSTGTIQTVEGDGLDRLPLED
jgi:hypothetical protein